MDEIPHSEARCIWTDAHNHLNDPELQGLHAELLDSFYVSGTCKAVVNGTSPNDWPSVVEVTSGRGALIPAFGLHPWYVADAPSDWQERLDESLKLSKATIGEIGLDAGKGRPDLGLQIVVCRTQIQMAASHQAPVSFHCYKAWPQLIGLIRETKGGLSRFVLHSFHGPLDVIEEVTELGGYFSLSPSFFRLSAEQRASYYSRIPPHRLLLETDAPNQFLPASYGDTNGRDPRLIRSLFQLVGEDLDEDQVTLKRRIAENFHQAFEKGAAHAP